MAALLNWYALGDTSCVLVERDVLAFLNKLMVPLSKNTAIDDITNLAVAEVLVERNKHVLIVPIVLGAKELFQSRGRLPSVVCAN